MIRENYIVIYFTQTLFIREEKWSKRLSEKNDGNCINLHNLVSVSLENV